MEQTNDQIIEILSQAIAAESEDAAKAILVENIQIFPEDLKNKIIFQIFEDSITNQIAVLDTLEAIKLDMLSRFVSENQ